MKMLVTTTLALCLAACGGEEPSPEVIDAPPVERTEKADAQKTLRVEYYEINKK